MNFTKRKGSTKEKVAVKDFEKVKERYLQDIVDVCRNGRDPIIIDIQLGSDGHKLGSI